VWAVVPLKSLANAKQRLGPTLRAPERTGLVVAMLEDVLAALTATPGLAGILLVSRAAEAAAIARRHGIELFAEAIGADLSESVQAAGGYLIAHRDAAGTLILPADVPLVTPALLTPLLVDHERLTLVPDKAGEGTNCILSTPPNLIRYRFDGHSFRPHVEAAHAIGIAPRIVENAALGLDIDTPDDVGRLLREPITAGAQHTRMYLEGSGIASRLMHPHNAWSAI
jgi:2-phospho-L-lactate guanylyltransferase